MKFSAYRNLLIILVIMPFLALAQQEPKDTTNAVKVVPPAPPKEWYKRISLRGYTQVRYNRLFETNENLQCEQCDRSWGGDGGFFFRRIRLIFFGQISERLYIYIQPDFASSAGSGNNNFAQIRDAYFDLGLDDKNEFRFRFGQSKVPFGFENLQSSQNRTPLDRADALNSAVSNERDIGVFFYWAPKPIRDRFSYLVSSGLKGSGDYGVAGIGVHNGQTANRNETNDQPHVVGRLSYPFKVGKQIIEPGIQGFMGKATVATVTKDVTGNEKFEYEDNRAAASLVLYPQPFGIMAEYNIGTGPQYNPETNAIDQKNLKGGYALAQYLVKMHEQILIPFVRYQYYNGGKKHELDARRHHVRELEIGAEWQPHKNWEVVAMYTISERSFEDATKRNNFQEGRLLRLQIQFNY